MTLKTQNSIGSVFFCYRLRRAIVFRYFSNKILLLHTHTHRFLMNAIYSLIYWVNIVVKIASSTINKLDFVSLRAGRCYRSDTFFSSAVHRRKSKRIVQYLYSRRVPRVPTIVLCTLRKIWIISSTWYKVHVHVDEAHVYQHDCLFNNNNYWAITINND